MISDHDFAHWVYRMYDAEGRLLYVGMTVNQKKRIQVWRSVGRAAGHWWPQVADIQWEFHPDKGAAAAAERTAIQTESPLHNINGRLHPRVASSPGVSEADRQRIERANRMLDAYVNDDLTLDQIARMHGMTRERVRQVLNKHDRTLYQLAKIRRKARTRQRQAVAS